MARVDRTENRPSPLLRDAARATGCARFRPSPGRRWLCAGLQPVRSADSAAARAWSKPKAAAIGGGAYAPPPPPCHRPGPVANFSRPVCELREKAILPNFWLLIWILDARISTYSCVYTGSAERNSVANRAQKTLRQ